MRIYDQDSKPLHDLIRQASAEHGATLLVPDLQRPYVWSPNQVVLLVDSLLRGWPFGTLLLWEVKQEDLASIPSRPFWRIVDRTDDSRRAEQVSKSNPPAEFRMVLDGQQRLQSLLLAFGGDNWGFRLLDHEWSTTLDTERPKGLNARKHWSLGHLCIDLHQFLPRWKTAGDLSRLEFRDVMSWVVQSPAGGRSTHRRAATCKFPIKSALEPGNKGRYLRLSRLWSLARERAGTLPRHYNEPLTQLLKQHEVEEPFLGQLRDPLAELVHALYVIQQEKVSYLWLKSFNALDFTQDVYNDAIVNIFTRLNTAGRALTRQEITFAWIKTGWDSSKTEGLTAGDCFEKLEADLADVGVRLEIDELVGVIASMWAVLARNGELLTSNDLLRGEKVRPMAEDLVGRWQVISSNAIDGSELVRKRGLEFGTDFRSLNVLTLLLCWRLLGRQWLAGQSLSVTDKDSIEKCLDAAFNEDCDHWIILSLWSGKWGTSTGKAFAEYIKHLADDWAVIKSSTDPAAVLQVLKNRMTSWLNGLQSDAQRYIDDLGVLSREAVRQYYLPLWVWHRLDPVRWTATKVALRDSKRATVSTEVDHVVAVKLWEKLISESPKGSIGTDNDEEDDNSSPINALGNCCLLEKTFNISKGAEPLRAFLARVHEFKADKTKIAPWAESLSISAALVDPTAIGSDALTDVRKAVNERTDKMKAELKAYILGTRLVQDE